MGMARKVLGAGVAAALTVAACTGSGSSKTSPSPLGTSCRGDSVAQNRARRDGTSDVKAYISPLGGAFAGQSLPGTVFMRGEHATCSARAAAGQAATFQLPAGIYKATARSRRYNGGRTPCAAHVTTHIVAQQSHYRVVVVCELL